MLQAFTVSGPPPRYVRAAWAHSELTPFVGAVERRQLETDVLTVQDELGESRAELRELREQMASARRLACWLYEHGGQEVLDASGGGDTSEWPWLTAPDGRQT